MTIYTTSFACIGTPTLGHDLKLVSLSLCMLLLRSIMHTQDTWILSRSGWSNLYTEIRCASFPPPPCYMTASSLNPQCAPDDPVEQQPAIGLIGMGAMGKMYAQYLSQAGWKKYAALAFR